MTEKPYATEAHVRSSNYPVIERPRPILSTRAIVGLMIVFGLLLFLVLTLRRPATSAPTTLPITTSEVRPLPALVLPPPVSAQPPNSYLSAPLPAYPASPPVSLAPPPNGFLPAAPSRPQTLPPSFQGYAGPPLSPPAPAPPRASGGPAVVYDAGAPGGVPAGAGMANRSGANGDPTALASGSDRARAGAFLNKSTTIAQGTIIPAVLETAFDSTGPGFARALVQHDVRGFDGSLVLVPRGSRLLGSYRAVPAAGQKRVLITWFRLIRPDGVTIDLDSPASDTLGRGGVRAEVDSHFFERFAGAILQSALDVGVNLASRRADSSVVVALPGSVGTASQAIVPQTRIPPTLKIRAGTSVSVFVARDLDFTGQE